MSARARGEGPAPEDLRLSVPEGAEVPQALPDAGTPQWRSGEERGSIFWIKAMVIFATMFGRGPARVIVAFVAFYFTLFSGAARRAVHAFRRHLGEPTGFWAAYRQVLRFAQCSLDTLFFLQGKTKYFTVSRNGHHHLEELRAKKQGAILLGAHLGSFSAMRMQSAKESLPLHPVVYTKHAKRFNRVLEELDPGSKVSLIEMGEGGEIDFMLAIREKLESGALVAILGDRTQAGKKNVTVDFLGGKAELPAGPYLLASMLRCPVYFTAGLYRGGNHYELYCIPFAERIDLPRGRREEGIQRYAQQYADQLAELCRSAPDNWFNFYDFWKPKAADEAPPKG
ncbi:MAG: lipid A biosynthesis acyltransferase [Sandaracinus sp.]|nr:lipid A biosynthesis acyltransferase [Sandaracinus sp.]MCB9632955.1 lipid A biosynthesis acyltransferase [Sandaracinus sp.]